MILYILLDFKNLRKNLVFAVEFIVALLMVIDVLFFSLVKRESRGIVNIIEYLIIMTFISVFIYLGNKDLNEIDEGIELFLMLLRFILQCSRFIISIFRIKEN